MTSASDLQATAYIFGRCPRSLDYSIYDSCGRKEENGRACPSESTGGAKSDSSRDRRSQLYGRLARRRTALLTDAIRIIKRQKM